MVLLMATLLLGAMVTETSANVPGRTFQHEWTERANSTLPLRDAPVANRANRQKESECNCRLPEAETRLRERLARNARPPHQRNQPKACADLKRQASGRQNVFADRAPYFTPETYSIETDTKPRLPKKKKQSKTDPCAIQKEKTHRRHIRTVRSRLRLRSTLEEPNDLKTSATPTERRSSGELIQPVKSSKKKLDAFVSDPHGEPSLQRRIVRNCRTNRSWTRRFLSYQCCRSQHRRPACENMSHGYFVEPVTLKRRPSHGI